MKDLRILAMLYASITIGFAGLGLFKSFIQDFSLIEFSFNNAVPPLLGGPACLAIAIYLGFRALRNLCRS